METRGGVWVDPAEPATEHDHLRDERVHERREADGEPPTEFVERVQGGWISALGLLEHYLELTPAAVGSVPRPAQERPFADLGLPTSDRAAAAAHARRVDLDMAHLAGAPRGVGTYGSGLALLAVVPLSADIARPVLRRLSGPPAVALDTTALADADGRAVATPLVNAVAVRLGRRYYLLAGTVQQSVLERAVAALAANPPPRRSS